jgi:hypothetical protein
MRHGNVAYAFLYGFLYILALALVLALAEYARRRKIRNPKRRRKNRNTLTQNQTIPQNVLVGNPPARAKALRSVVQTIRVVGTGARRVGERVKPVQRINNVISPIQTRVTQRIFKAPILFPNVPNPPRRVAVRNDNLIEIHVLEQKPQARQVTWNVGGQRIDLKKFELSYPYIGFRFTFYQGLFDSLFLYYRNSPANGSPDTRFYPSNLCNVAGNGKVCLGNGIQETLSRFAGLSKDKQIEHILNFFWFDSAFDLGHMPDANFLPWANMEPELRSLEEWEKCTLRNPLFILSINWERRGIWFTLDQLLNPFFETGG